MALSIRSPSILPAGQFFGFDDFSYNLIISADEDDIAGGIGDTAPGDDAQANLTGTLAFEAGADGATVGFSGIHGTQVLNANGNAVQSDGAALKFAWIGDTLYATTAADPLNANDGNSAFKVVIDPATGAYTFTLLDQLDHGVSGTEDNINIKLSYTVTDGDGDTATGTVWVSVDDDLPTAVSHEPSTPGFVYNPENGHYYMFVSDQNTVYSWQQAEAAAEGLGGYLATITSQQENDFVLPLMGPGSGAWLGGQSPNVDGNWTWVTGPEAGTKFWAGGPIGGQFANWNSGEPSSQIFNVNGVLIPENSLHFAPPLFGLDPTKWNDLNDADNFPGGENFVNGYLVEIGGLPGNPNATVLLDDDALTGGNLGGNGDDVNAAQVTGILGHNYGADGPGAITLLSSVALPLGFTGALSAGNSVLTISQGGTPVLQVTITNAVTGAYLVEQLAAIDHPEGNDENNLNFVIGYQVTDGDGDTATGTFAINVDDDTPTAIADNAGTIAEDAPFAYNVLTNDVKGADQGATLTAANLQPAYSLAGTVTFLANGQVTFDPAPGFAGPVVIDYTMQDGDGDPSSSTLTLNVAPDSIPSVSVTDGIVDEKGLADGTGELADPALNSDTSETTTGSFSITTGNDTLQSLKIEDKDGNLVDVTNGGVVNGDYGVLTVTGPGGGYTWSYTLSDNTLNHTNTSTDLIPGDRGLADQVTDAFTVIVTDSDNTQGSDTLTILVNDDGPIAAPNSNSVNEGALLSVSAASGVLGNDVAGADGFAPAGGVVGVRSAGGDTTTPVLTGVATSIVGEHGTLMLQANGGYTYQSNANAIAANDTDVFVYTIRDADGDLATTTLTINLTDSGLVAAADDEVLVYESALDTAVTGSDLAAGTITGSLGGASALETDASNTLVGNATGGFGALTYALVSGGNAATAGSYGTIQINSNGTYVYTLTKPYDTSPDANNANNMEQNRDSFIYRVTDANGNTSTAVINVDIVDDAPVLASVTTGLTLDEDDLSDGSDPAPKDPLSVIGSLNVNLGADGGAIALASSGASWNAGTSTLTGAGNVWQIVLNTNGTYTFTLLDNTLAHTTGNGENTLGPISVTYTATDGDGDTLTGSFGINIVDDVPTAVNDTDDVGTGSTALGNVINGAGTDGNPAGADTLGADGAVVSHIESNNPGGSANTVVGASVTINGQYGTLLIESDGDYTYTRTSPGAGTDTFNYTLRDGDGDTSTATLTIDLDSTGILVVGSNESDDNPIDPDHTVPGPSPLADSGTINGLGGNDLLIGDPGAIVITEGQTANIVLVLDSSGSMTNQISFGGGTISRMQALKNGTNALIDSLAASGAEDIRITVIDFDDHAPNLGTFDLIVNGVVQTGQVTAAKTAVNGMAAEDGTNYEAGLQQALNWIGSASPLSGADVNKVVFVSDGNPTFWYTSGTTLGGDGGEGATNVANAMNQVLGGDGSNEPQLILAAGYGIEAVGVNVSAANLDRLSDVEDGVSGSGGGGSATNATSAEQLAAVLSVLGGSTDLAAAGSDVINGGAGNDIIFGDVPFTDTLANTTGLSTQDGAGWAVFQTLEGRSNNEVIDPAGNSADWTRADSIAYIQQNAAEIAHESGRTGGNDVISGGAGDDTIYAQEGSDTILYTVGDGRDAVHGGSDGATGDMLDVTGTAAAENFFLETVADYNTRVNPDYAGPHEILLSDGSGNIMVEMTEIEHVVVHGGGGADTLTVSGAFTGTSLLTSTIQFFGEEGSDTLDLTSRESGHRVVADGGADTDTAKLDFAYGDITGVVAVANGFQISHDGITDIFTNFESFQFTDVTLSYADLTSAPNAPSITSVTDNVGTITGAVAHGGVTNDPTLFVKIGLASTGAVAGDSVQLFSGAVALGAAVVLTAANITNGFVEMTTPALAHGTTNGLNAKVTDLFGNTSAASANHTVTVDTAAPTATIVVADPALTVGETSLVTITFNEPVTGFTNAGLAVPNGTLSAVASSDGGTTWTATYTPNVNVNDTTNVITLANSGVADAAGNSGAGSTNSSNFTIDTVPNVAPVANNDIVLTNITDGSPIVIPVAALLANDTDADSDPLTVSGASGASGGVVTDGAGVVTFTPTVFAAQTLIDADFTSNDGGFVYADDVFMPSDSQSGNPATGTRLDPSGFGSGNVLNVALGGGTGSATNMNGAWTQTFTLTHATTVTISFDYMLTMTNATDPGEDAQLLLSVDGALIGTGLNDFVAELQASNAGGPDASGTASTGSQSFEVSINLGAGSHTLALGGFLSAKGASNESANDYFDNVEVVAAAVPFTSGGLSYNASDGSVTDTASVTITGVAGSTITGTAASEIIIAGGGNDTIVGAQNDALLSGGGGTDTLQVGASFNSTSDAQITGIENVTLTAPGLTLNLSQQSDGFKILGSSGADFIIGSSGVDIINGQGGTDTFTGGGDADQFRLATNAGGVKTITDYTDNTDKIAFFGNGSGSGGSVDFDNTNGTAMGATLDSDDFVTRATVSAISNNDDNNIIRITTGQSQSVIEDTEIGGSGSPTNNYILVFNTDTQHGEIWFDSNWDSDSGRVKIATLDNVATLAQLNAITAADILVYSSAVDPIVLDLNGDGLSFTSIGDGVTFDINADGALDQVAWTGDGILAYDLDGSGKIENGAEIFTPVFGGGSFADGLNALSSLNSEPGRQDRQPGCVLRQAARLAGCEP